MIGYSDPTLSLYFRIWKDYKFWAVQKHFIGLVNA